MHKSVTTKAEPQRLKVFSPGEMAPISGIYKVVHKTGHRPAHEVMAIRGEHFPSCRICRNEVEYRTMRAISHMAHDWDFAGPTDNQKPYR